MHVASALGRLPQVDVAEMLVEERTGKLWRVSALTYGSTDLSDALDYAKLQAVLGGVLLKWTIAFVLTKRCYYLSIRAYN